jgi:NAD(P)-dependent dehydrogenase (short-subunit alcohol dehydrogenase family)
LRNRRVPITGVHGGESLPKPLPGDRVSLRRHAEAPSRALVQRLASSDRPPRYEHCDLTDVRQLRATIAAIEADFGSIEVLVNNAANDDRHALVDVTPEYWDDRIAVNLRHMFFCSQAVVPGMKKAGGGVILNFGSISGVALLDVSSARPRGRHRRHDARDDARPPRSTSVSTPSSRAACALYRIPSASADEQRASSTSNASSGA